jgi:hypothetical protein
MTIRRVDSGLVDIDREPGLQPGLWVRMKLRKATQCRLTGNWLKAGEDAYRPLTTSRGRSQRIGAAALEARL